MNARDIQSAAIDASVPESSLCGALTVVLPVLRQLARKQNFLTRLFVAGFIAAIEEYVSERCG